MSDECTLLIQELAVYGVFVLFFFIAAILASVVASQFHGYYEAASAGAAAVCIHPSTCVSVL